MLSYDFWFKTLRDSKFGVAKGHGKNFRSRLASSFSGIVHCCPFKTLSKNIALDCLGVRFVPPFSIKTNISKWPQTGREKRQTWT